METTAPYLTANELNIEAWERDELIALIGPLSRRELQVEMGWATKPNSSSDGVRSWRCGTVHCIGGWLGFARFGADRLRIEAYVDGIDAATPLHALFCPPALDAAAWEATAPQAALAIVNFLTTGDPRWSVATSQAA